MCNTSFEIVFLCSCRSFRNALLRSTQLWRTHHTALPGLAHQMKHWSEPGGKRQMQFWGLHHMITISFIYRRHVLITDPTWFVRSQLRMDNPQMLLFPIQSTRNWTEITRGTAWQTQTRYQIKQSHWTSDHWTSSPTVSSSRSWETLSRRAEQRLSPHKFVPLDSLTSYRINKDLRDAFSQSFAVTYEQAVESLFFWQTWMELIRGLESYWWEMENQASRMWPLDAHAIKCVCIYTLYNTHSYTFDSSISC